MTLPQPQLFGELDSSVGATFSECRRYRFTLNRTWDADRPKILFVMLNPSTADELNNDPTVERCQRRAIKWGYGALGVANLFAYRSTSPMALYECEDPVGTGNDDAIVQQARESDMVICAWGSHGALNDRGMHVRKLLTDAGIKLHYLHLNADGTPGHPLYLAYELQPTPWVD